VALNYLPFMNPNRTNGPRRIVTSRHQNAWTPLRTSLRSARIALISSAAVRHVDQPAFQPPQDTSYRAVPFDTPASELRIDHRSPVGSDARLDLEVVVPRAALAELTHQGTVGSIAPSFFSLVGGTELHQEVEQELVPALAEELRGLDVDLALLVPY
jgi:D-proline reductase (dithiol) PrdB